MAKPASNLAKSGNAFMNWSDQRLPVTAFWNATITGYYAPKKLKL